jgi:phosphatidylserine decarboxylase
MADQSGTRLDERRRLGGWLPSKEAALAEFRKDLAIRARQRAGKEPLASAVQELAALVNDDPVLRMDFTRAIDDARAAGFELGYSTIPVDGVDQLYNDVCATVQRVEPYHLSIERPV